MMSQAWPMHRHTMAMYPTKHPPFAVAPSKSAIQVSLSAAFTFHRSFTVAITSELRSLTVVVANTISLFLPFDVRLLTL